MRKCSGFSLMELMVVLAIAAILAAIAVPNMFSWRPKNVLMSATEDLKSSVQLARVTAIKERSDVVLKFSADWDEFLVFVDNGAGGGNVGNGIQDGNERTVRSKRLPTGVSITAVDPAAATEIKFNSRGLMIMNPFPGSIKKVDMQNTEGEAGIVEISMAGTARIQ